MHLNTMPCGHILAKKFDYFKIYLVFTFIVLETLAGSTVWKIPKFYPGFPILFLGKGGE